MGLPLPGVVEGDVRRVRVLVGPAPAEPPEREAPGPVKEQEPAVVARG